MRTTLLCADVEFILGASYHRIAQMIARIEDADLYEIVSAVPHIDDDINYNDNSFCYGKT